MGNDDGQGIRMTRADVDEVNVEPVDPRDELRERIELRLRLPPVVVRAPVADELLQLGELRALRPVGDGLLVRPARGGNAPAQVVERGLRYLHLEGADGAILGRAMGAARGGERNEAERKRDGRQFLESHVFPWL
jgi:hypothetical protein